MDIDGVIFDLDETLLDTSALRDARQQGRWGDVMRRLEEVEEFEIEESEVAVVDLPARLRAAGTAVGILTASPRHYAEALLERFGIPHDALITGSDGYNAKPDPGGLRAIATELGVPIERCAHVGDTDTDTAAAVKAGALAVGVCWSTRAPKAWRRWWPEISISDPGLILRFAEGEKLRLLAEAAIAGNDPEWHWGTLAAVDDGLFALGRYFPTGDLRNAAELSPLILAAKDDPARAPEVATIFARLADNDEWRDRFERVCSVPPKPGAAFDRFGVVRADLAPRLGADDGGANLVMNFEVANYKQMNHDARRAANAGRFTANGVTDETVLLIDDVVTSGGQAEACRDALLAAGAREVVIVGLGLTQEAMPETCPQCGVGLLKVFRRHRDNHPFVGCNNYWTTGCGYTRDIA